MKGSKKVLKVLNEALAEEVLAIVQYELHHSHAEEGLALTKLAGIFREASINEMKHMEQLSERIIFLEGTPNVTLSGKPVPGCEPLKMVEADLKFETDAVRMYNKAVAVCAAEGDNGSKMLLEAILKDEEGHVKIFEDQRDLIKRLGNQYIATLV